MGGEPGGEWIHAYVEHSPFTVHQKLTQHCWSAIFQYKIKYFLREMPANEGWLECQSPPPYLDPVHLGKIISLNYANVGIQKDIIPGLWYYWGIKSSVLIYI